jgi:hypothetical protein
MTIRVGKWLSLVEHSVRDAGVAGSNPVFPTNLPPERSLITGLSPPKKVKREGSAALTTVLPSLSTTDRSSPPACDIGLIWKWKKAIMRTSGKNSAGSEAASEDI